MIYAVSDSALARGDTMKYRLWMIIVMISMLFAACPDTGSNTKPNIVSPNGGVLSFNEGAVKFEFPAGAVSQDTTINVQASSITPTDPSPIPGRSFSFSPDGISFAKPVKLSAPSSWI
jgi:hypothetical protein